jgi:DNA-binding MarR family transcriptional regulator
MMDASVTTAQVILLHLSQKHPNSMHSELARAMKLSPSSTSQMVQRLVKMDFLARADSAKDRRVRTLAITLKGRSFLKRLQIIRAREYAVGTEALSSATRERLIQVISQALTELPERTVPASTPR